MRVEIIEPASQSVVGYLLEQKIKVPVPCGGKGSCGKCKVRVIEGEAPISPADQNLFSKEQLEKGERLACQLPAKHGQVLEVEEEKENTFCIVSSYERILPIAINTMQSGYGIGIDIGTTTIALELIEIQAGKVLGAYTLLNSQRQYGADVISRIQFSTQGGIKKLQRCIHEDILKGIKILTEEKNITSGEIKKVVIAGNTTLLHTLMGINCESLGQYPFTPHIIGLTKLRFDEVFIESEYKAELILLPGISAYVGADITSGMYFCHMDETQKTTIFIDIGTNGEMAIGNQENILALATAAGPAFEGGNISSGVGSIKGAISSVCYENNRFKCGTIGNEDAIGICGSGLIDSIAECIRHKLIDETGYIESGEEEIVIYQGDQGNIAITQQDIRQVQLAKAAIRAGVEALILECGTTYDDIELVYLAGGFGKHINIESILELGMIPKELGDKIIKVGNTSLGGCMDYLLDEQADKKLKKITKKAQAINLVECMRFNELFIEHMVFEE